MTKMTLKIGVFAGLFAGLILVGCQSRGSMEEKTPLNTQIVRLGDTVVAEVDGTSIFLSDIEHMALAKGVLTQKQSLTPKSPVFQAILDELIDQRLLALEALRRSLDQNDETRRRLAVARERILANVVVETLLAEKVTEDSIKRMYAEQSALQSKSEQVRARHIVVATQEQAKELKGLVEQGGSFAALAKEFTIDPSTQDLGGDLGYFSKNAMEDVIAAQAFALETGDISEPFETKYGWHILTTTDRRAMPRPALKTIRSEIVSYMTYEEIQKLLKSLRSASAIELKLGQASTTEPKEDKPDAP